MLVNGEEFSQANPPQSPLEWRETVFRYCTFDGVDLEGLSFSGIMERCTLTGCDAYWGLFNTALLARTHFIDCAFPGTSFRGCTLVHCTFEHCVFELDNLGGDCTIDDCTFADCTLDSCVWIVKPGAKGRDITRTRWLACHQVRCEGLSGLF